jgi:prostaglandin-H2 D-isomerase / glutathione transferase
MLSVDGADYTQSEAILRYCGKMSGLYPRDDDLAALDIDEVLGVCVDIRSGMLPYRGPDMEKVREAREEFKATKLPILLGGLEKIVKSKSKSETWLCGDSITIADLQFYYVVGNVTHGFVDHIGGEVFEAYPRLLASYNAVLENPKVKAWNADHPWKK